MYYIILIFLLSIICSTSIIFFTKKFNLDKKNKIIKIIAIVYFAVFIIRLFARDYFVRVDRFMDFVGGVDFGTSTSIIMTDIMRWSMRLTVLLLSLTVFTNSNNLRNLLIFIGTPSLILNTIFFNRNMFCFLGEVNNLHYLNFVFAIELVVGFVIIAYLLFGVKYRIQFKNNWKVLIKGGLLCLPCLMLISFPLDLLQHWIGTTNISADTMDFGQHVWILIIVVIIIALAKGLKNKTYDTKFTVMLFLSISMFINYFGKFDITTMTIGHLPFHICNLATALIPIALITKNQLLFSFTYFVNVSGAILSILLPENANAIFSYSFLVFAYEHMFALICPLMFVQLGIIPRTSKKNFKFAFASFTLYFILAIVLNVWLYNYDPAVNYFYLNNDFLPNKIKLLQTLKDLSLVRFDLGSLTISLYPLFYISVYIGFLAFLVLSFFIYRAVYKFQDTTALVVDGERRERLNYLDFIKSLNGRSFNEPYKKEKTVMVSFENFSKKYAGSDVYAVEGFNLQIKEGEIFGFLGSNGAGKSTTIKSLVGILPFEQGKIYIDGYDIVHQTLECKKLIGYVPDNHAVYERLTGRQYINYVADLFEVEKNERDSIILDLVNKFNLVEAIDKPIKSYSHGMKQKITIISALVHNPKLWVLDEPLTGLDPQSSYEVKTYMREHANKGNTVFFSSHIIEVVEQICDRVAIIYKGKLKGVYSMKEIAKSGESLVQLFINSQKDGD